MIVTNTNNVSSYKLVNFRKRFGPEYFRRVPARPGVFWMTDAKRNWLFVGKSKNIKERLQAFRYEKRPDLSHQIHNIQWEECPSVEASNELHEVLLRRYRPPFNKSHQSDFSYSISLKMNSHYLLMRNNPPHPEGFMEFNLPFAQKVAPSLMRSLWKLINPLPISDLPPPLTKTKAPEEIQIPMKYWHDMGGLQRKLYDLLSATNIHCLNDFSENIKFLKNQGTDPFLISWLEKDHQSLQDYFLKQMMNQRMKC